MITWCCITTYKVWEKSLLDLYLMLKTSKAANLYLLMIKEEGFKWISRILHGRIMAKLCLGTRFRHFPRSITQQKTISFPLWRTWSLGKELSCPPTRADMAKPVRPADQVRMLYDYIYFSSYSKFLILMSILKCRKWEEVKKLKKARWTWEYAMGIKQLRELLTLISLLFLLAILFCWNNIILL